MKVQALHDNQFLVYGDKFLHKGRKDFQNFYLNAKCPNMEITSLILVTINTLKFPYCGKYIHIQIGQYPLKMCEDNTYG